MRSQARAVSDVLGYALVFSLVVSSVAIVSTAGVDQLEGVRDAEQMNNAERAFDLLATNMDDIAREGAPSRATEMRLVDAQLDVADPIEVTFRGIDEDDPAANNFTESYDVWPVVYRGQVSDSEVVYAGGTVFRTYPDSGVALRKPSIIAENGSTGENRTVIPLVHTRSRSVQSRSGGIARVRATHASTELLVSDTSGTYETVFVNVTSPRADLWVDMLDEYEALDCSLDESGMTDRAWCRGTNPDRFHVALVQIDVELSR